MRTRNSKYGLTSIELLLSLGGLAVLVTVGMIFWTRYDREKWRAIASAEPQRVFAIECQPLAPEFHGDDPIAFECEVTNAGPYAVDFRLTGFRFAPKENLRPFSMDWAVLHTPDEVPTKFLHSSVTLPIDAGEALTFRLRHDSLFRGPTPLPKFSDVVKLEGTITAGFRTDSGFAAIESNPVILTMHPPERGATASATIPTENSP